MRHERGRRQCQLRLFKDPLVVVTNYVITTCNNNFFELQRILHRACCPRNEKTPRLRNGSRKTRYYFYCGLKSALTFDFIKLSVFVGSRGHHGIVARRRKKGPHPSSKIWQRLPLRLPHRTTQGLHLRWRQTGWFENQSGPPELQSGQGDRRTSASSPRKTLTLSRTFPLIISITHTGNLHCKWKL